MARLSDINCEAEARASIRVRIVTCFRREAWRSTHVQGEGVMVSRWRSELIGVAKPSDDMWVGVKGQSS